MSEQIISAFIMAAATFLAALLAVYWGLKQFRAQHKLDLQLEIRSRKELAITLAKEQREADKVEEEKRFKIQFDIDCKIYCKADKGMILEVLFVISNQGNTEHRIWNTEPYEDRYRGLQLLIQGLEEGANFPSVGSNGRVKFTNTLCKVNVMSPKLKYIFIRPNVRQTISHVVHIEEDQIPDLLQIGGRFYYDKSTPHMASRVFNVPAYGSVNLHADRWLSVDHVLDK